MAIPITAIMCAAIFIPWVVVWLWITPLPDTVQEQVDDAIDLGLDGIIVYVDQAGEAPVLYCAGLKNREAKVPTDPHALFKIASISKLYIAVATAKLISDQRLSLNDTLASLLPELDGRLANAHKITLRMLLQHRSGIPDWIEDPAFPWTRSVRDIDEVLEFVLDDPAEFEPDSRYDYSNTNYLLIGKILDRTLGYHHHQYIQEEILVSLGLTHTFGLLSEVMPEEVSSGYYTKHDGDVKGLDFVSPGSSMVATAQDVGIFLKALNDGSLLDDDEQAIYSSVYVYEHTGLIPGYSSIARYRKDIDTVVIQFVNTSGGNTWTLSEVVCNRIIRILKRSNNASNAKGATKLKEPQR